LYGVSGEQRGGWEGGKVGGIKEFYAGRCVVGRILGVERMLGSTMHVYDRILLMRLSSHQ